MIARKIKSFDRYSRIITFSFKGKESFGTLFGGFISLATYIVLTIYAYAILRIMFERNGTTKNITTTINDLYNDSDQLQLDGSSFMFGLGFVGNNGFHGFDDTYIKVSTDYIKGTFISN